MGGWAFLTGEATDAVLRRGGGASLPEIAEGMWPILVSIKLRRLRRPPAGRESVIADPCRAGGRKGELHEVGWRNTPSFAPQRYVTNSSMATELTDTVFDVANAQSRFFSSPRRRSDSAGRKSTEVMLGDCG